MAAAKGSSKNHVFRAHSHAYWDIGFTDSSNPFYLFSKLNAGLLLWAPFAWTMREEHSLLIALEADGWTLMPRTATAESRAESQAGALVSDRRVDHRRRIDGSQIAQPTFVAAHGGFTLGGR
jgi:hypothetical protein